MNFTLPPPSLVHRTYVNIAIMLWTQDDIRRLTAKSFYSLTINWHKIEKMIEKKASMLCLPVILKKRLLEYIRPIGFQIISWIEFYAYSSFETELIPRLFWTPHGTLDNKRTGEAMVKNVNLPAELRFKMACFYCLKDDVLDLQKKYCTIGRIDSNFFTSFWPSYLKESEVFRRKQILLDNFTNFAIHGNETAIKYFCFKLNTENTEELRVQTAKLVAWLVFLRTTKFYVNEYSAILCFLLSTMNEEQQAEVLLSYTYEILKSLLIWPRQCLFLDVAKGSWNFLSKDNYYYLLHDIIDRMSFDQNDFSELFGEFWQQTPETFKQYVVSEQCDVERLFRKLHNKKDVKNVQLISKYLCSEKMINSVT